MWGTEPSPSKAPLGRLTAEESALYTALANDAFGASIRLEQELTAGTGRFGNSIVERM